MVIGEIVGRIFVSISFDRVKNLVEHFADKIEQRFDFNLKIYITESTRTISLGSQRMTVPSNTPCFSSFRANEDAFFERRRTEFKIWSHRCVLSLGSPHFECITHQWGCCCCLWSRDASYTLSICTLFVRYRVPHGTRREVYLHSHIYRLDWCFRITYMFIYIVSLSLSHTRSRWKTECCICEYTLDIWYAQNGNAASKDDPLNCKIKLHILCIVHTCDVNPEEGQWLIVDVYLSNHSLYTIFTCFIYT